MSLFFGMNLSAMSARSVGSVWQPKARKLSVGKELCPISATAFSGEDRNIVTARGDDTRFMSNDLFRTAKSVAAMGLKTRHFRSVKTEEFTYSSLSASGAPATAAKAAASNRSLVADADNGGELLRHGNYKVTFNGSAISVWKKDEQGRFSVLAAAETVRDDTRLSWSKNGEPVFTTGSAALKGGKITADGADNVLVRKSGADVAAGDGSVVINLSQDKGKFTGGSNVTYLGAYTKSVIEGGEGKTTFAGYFDTMESVTTKGQGVYSGVFENTVLEGAEASDTYSGYFANVTINASKGNNNFSGLFLGGSSVTGGDDGNSFGGRFIDSILKSGDGDDTIGRRVNLAGQGTVVTRAGETYTGLEADIIDSLVDSGEGNDTFSGFALHTNVALNGGDNKVSGIFMESSVTSMAGNDAFAVMFSASSTFDAGDGSDSVTIGTATSTSVRTGEGSASIVMGNNKNKSNAVEGGFLMAGDAGLANTTFQTYEQMKSDVSGMEYGELTGNTVIAETGENFIRVNTGEGSRNIRTGSIITDEPEKEPLPDVPLVAEPEPEEKAENKEELGRQAVSRDKDAQDLSIIENVANTVAQLVNVPDKKMRNALERYARQSGDGAVIGSTGVTVATGSGEDIAVRTFDRNYNIDLQKISGIHRTTRRTDGDGVFRWETSRT